MLIRLVAVVTLCSLASCGTGEIGVGSSDGPDRFADLGGDELGPDHLFCKGTDDDCGAFVCTDCSISSLGHRCRPTRSAAA